MSGCLIFLFIGVNNGSESSPADSEVFLCNNGPSTGVVTLQGSEVRLEFKSDLSVNAGGYQGTFLIAPIDTGVHFYISDLYFLKTRT